MSHLFTSLAVAFAAFCIWLTVRIVNRRERWAKWTLAVVTGLPMLYVATFWPACWLVRHGHMNAYDAARIYRPLVDRPANKWLSQALMWFGGEAQPGMKMSGRL